MMIEAHLSPMRHESVRIRLVVSHHGTRQGERLQLTRDAAAEFLEILRAGCQARGVPLTVTGRAEETTAAPR